VGSGSMAQKLAGDNGALALLCNTPAVKRVLNQIINATSTASFSTKSAQSGRSAAMIVSPVRV
jgi:hypothetical protein